MTTLYDPEATTHPLDVARSAAYVGAASAIPGLAYGAFYGTLKTKTPVLFSLASGAQCGAIGATFWATRACILNRDGLVNWWDATRNLPMHTRNDLNPTPSDKVIASSVAGAFTGLSMGLILRGPRNAIPGTFLFALYGFLGQHGYNYLDQRNSRELQEKALLKERSDEHSEQPKLTLMQRFAKSKWSPFTLLSNEEYEHMLEEKLLKIEADIAIIDERIEAFKKLAAEAEAEHQKREQQDKTAVPMAQVKVGEQEKQAQSKNSTWWPFSK